MIRPALVSGSCAPSGIFAGFEAFNRAATGASYVMPDLIGTNGERASETLRSRGFRVTIVGSQPYSGVPPGTVVRQQPAGGFRVGPGEAISLEVSR